YMKLNKELTLILKLGSKGCFYSTLSKSGYIKRIHVDNLVDPIGAGDAFAAGFVSGILNNMALKQSLEQANIIGSMIIQFSGDVEGFPFKEQFEAYKNSILNSLHEEVDR